MRNHYAFVGGPEGLWRVTDFRTLVGEPIAEVPRIAMLPAAHAEQPRDPSWVLRGFTSNVRYAERREVDQLRARQQGLDRPAATCGALIPIRKSPAWWGLSQDERRAVFEAQSHHTEIGLGYVPAIARQLHHCRDLGEPFDFLTWFEFAPEWSPAFDRLLAQLRVTAEWDYVDREVEIRLVRDR